MRSSHSQKGFTLVELLLVFVIIGIIAAVVTPSLVKSIRGNRLRTAARSVVMAGRYARSMAVLKQKPIEVTFNIDSAVISIGGGETRTLDGVSMEYVKIEGAESFSKGSCSVTYRNNGRCAPYSVKILDDRGGWVIIEVDALSSARTEGG